MFKSYLISISVFFITFTAQIISTTTTYTVEIRRYSSQPIISSSLGAEIDPYGGAGIFTDEDGSIGVILPGTSVSEPPQYPLCFSRITFKNGIPVASQPKNRTIFVLEDINFPTIVKYNELYYVTYLSSSNGVEFAVTSNPKNPNEWISAGACPISHDPNVVYQGAPLFATSENLLTKNYFFYSSKNGTIFAANSPIDTTNWDNTNTQIVGGNAMVGSPPIQLKTGDFFMIFNSAVRDSLSYAILDKSDPTKVIQTAVLLQRKLLWETDGIYLTGLLTETENCPEENNWTQCFFGMYNGNSGNLGALKIVVSWA